MNRTHMPADWQPPADGFTGTWHAPGPLVMAVFGAQGEPAQAFLLAWLRRTTAGAHAPFELCHGSFSDRAGLANRIAIGYWSVAEYRSWWDTAGVADWWSDGARTGCWREVMQVPPERRETLFSSRSAEGMARSADAFDGPIQEHGYWGAARDRIPLSASSALAGCERLHGVPGATPQHRRVTGTTGLCVIRSGQDWRACAGEEREYYLAEIRPVLERGMHYLIDQPDASHCHACRLIRQCDADGRELEQSFALAYFRDLRYLELWAREHATHHAIFDGFLQMAARFGESLSLRLWHEVFVLGEEAAEFEYIGCHGQTGLLAAL